MDRAGTTYYFAHERWVARVFAAFFGLIGVILSAVIASPAGPHIGALGKAGLIVIIAAMALLLTGLFRAGVRVSTGRVAVVRGWRTRTVDTADIREITLDAKSNGQNTFWTPRMRLMNGDDIWLLGLSCGSVSRPPVPWRLASFDTFQSLVGSGQVPAGAAHAPYVEAWAPAGAEAVAAGPAPAAAGATGDDPAAWTKGRQVSAPAGFYRDPGGRPGVRYWGGGEWSPLFPAAFAKKQVTEFPGTVAAPLPAADGAWGYAASQGRKARTQSAAFAAGAVIVLILIIEQWVNSDQLPYLGFVLALRAIFACRSWRRWTKLDRAARTQPDLDSLVL